MPKASNYFEEAMRLCGDNDVNVSLITETIYRKMLAENLNNNIIPMDGFNILYFFQSTVRVWFSLHSSAVLVSDHFPYPCQPIRVTNRLISSDVVGGQSEFVRQFVKVVDTDSVVLGDPFDLQYAVRILTLTFDDSGNLREPVDPKLDMAVDFEYWPSDSDCTF